MKIFNVGCIELPSLNVDYTISCTSCKKRSKIVEIKTKSITLNKA